MQTSLRALAALVFFGLASGAHAQDAPVQSASLVVQTSTPEAWVVVDGETLGAAGEGPFALEAGTRSVVLVEAGAAWEARRSQAEVSLASGETSTVRLDLPVRTRIESLPLRAEVALVHTDGSTEVLGITPLVVDRPEALDGTLVATLDGYTDAEAVAPEAGGRVSLVLRPEAAGADDIVSYALPTQRRNTARTILDVGLGVAAVAAGAVAVHYKFQADAADADYREPASALRGVPSVRDDALRYDTLSGIALGVSSASLGILALRFAIR